MLSWAYTFEWPLFAIFVIIIWIREMRMAVGKRTPAPEPEAATAKRRPLITRPAPDALAARADDDDDGDPKLAEYNRYLAWLSTHPDANPKEYPC